jgi:hypothetical protein
VSQFSHRNCFSVCDHFDQVPDASQPKAKTRGSAGVSLKDLVEM